MRAASGIAQSTTPWRLPLRLTRQGLQPEGQQAIPGEQTPQRPAAPALDDEQAWFECTREQLRSLGPWRGADASGQSNASGLAPTPGPHVDLLVDDELTLPGVLNGELWRLSRAELQAAALTWFAQQAPGVGWQVATVAQPDGHHALIAAMPRAVLQGTLRALGDAGLRTGRVLPRWALALSTVESDSTATATERERGTFTAVWTGSNHHALAARRVKGVWQVVEPEPVDSGHEPREDGGHRQHRISAPLPAAPTVAATAYSAAALDFVAPPAARATAAVRTAMAIAVAALAVVTVATGLDAAARHESRSSLARLGPSDSAGPIAPSSAVDPGAAPVRTSAPLPAERAAALQAEWASPWLPVLDRLADLRPPQIRLQRIEPVPGPVAGSLRVNVTAQAPDAADALAWVRKLSQDPQLREPRLIGWQREAEGSRVSFELEVAGGGAP